jgi:hypothetical protein
LANIPKIYKNNFGQLILKENPKGLISKILLEIISYYSRNPKWLISKNIFIGIIGHYPLDNIKAKKPI